MKTPEKSKLTEMKDLLILGIDTSGKNASAALYENGIFLAQKSVLTSLTHSQIIMPMVNELLESAKKDINDIDLFAVASGPGSYTGLRIGVSAVKALAFATKKCCVGTSVLAGLCRAANPRNCDVLCAIKARSNLVYAAMYSADNGVITQIMPDCITNIEQLTDIASKSGRELMITGDAAENIIENIDNANAYLSPKHLRISSAMGVCLAAADMKPAAPDELMPSYFEITKAEKELNSKAV